MEESKFIPHKASFDKEKCHLSFSKIRMKTAEEMTSVWEEIKSDTLGN